jgi:hypothetical protein
MLAVSQKEMLAKMERMMNTNQTDVKLKEPTETTSADTKTNQDELKSAIAQIEWKKPASVEMKSEAAHEVVPLEDAARMPVGEPRKRRPDRNMYARRRRKQQELTQKKDVCRMNLAVTRRGTTHRATVAWRKRNILRESWTQRNCGL